MGHGINSTTRKNRSRDHLHPVRDVPGRGNHGRIDLGRVADLDAVKMPLRVSADGDPAGNVRVVDANHMVVCRMSKFADALEMAEKIMRKLNDA